MRSQLFSRIFWHLLAGFSFISGLFNYFAGFPYEQDALLGVFALAVADILEALYRD